MCQALCTRHNALSCTSILPGGVCALILQVSNRPYKVDYLHPVTVKPRSFYNSLKPIFLLCSPLTKLISHNKCIYSLLS